MKSADRSPEKKQARRRRLWGLAGLLLLVLAAALALLEHSGRSRRPYRIYFVGKTSVSTIEFWRTIDEGLAAAAKEFNVELISLSAPDESHIEENVALFREAVAARPDAVILAATDYERLSEPVAEAVRGGQLVVMLDSAVHTVPGAEPASLIATNNLDAGKKIAEYFVSEQSADRRVLIVSQQLGAAPADQRLAGVLEVLNARGFTRVETLDAAGSKEIAEQVSLAKLRAGAADAVIALNEFTSEAVALALKEAGQDGAVPLYGIDSSRTLVPFIEDGTIRASVIQRPFNIAYLSVKTAVDAIEGRRVPEQIDVESELITKETLYLPENQKLLFPFQLTD